MKFKINNWLHFIIALTACLILSPSITTAKDLTSIELIDHAYRNGRLTYKEAINYKVSAIIKQDSLPDEFKSKSPMKSGTTVMMEARSNRHLLSGVNTRLLQKRIDTITEYYDSGITLLSYVSPNNHFRIHYTIDSTSLDAVSTNDADGDSIPDYIEKFAEILDNVWMKEVDEMGFEAPPSDGTEGGDGLLDVYLADLDAYGFTNINIGDPVSTVHIILENDYNNFPCTQEDCMKVVAAHEFFHTIQFQITDDIDNYGWWMEASATWMEDELYPDINDYINYLDRWFQHPELPLDTFENDIYQYGTSVWVKHMTENYGTEVVFDVWNNIKNGDSALTGIEKVLIAHNSSLQEEVKNLRVDNLTYNYTDGEIYKYWSTDYPVSIIPTSFENFSTSLTINASLDILSAKYYAFYAPSGSGSLNIDFDGTGEVNVMLVMFKSSDDTFYDVSELITDSATNSGTISINGFSQSGLYKKIVIIPLSYSATTLSSFVISACYVSSADSPTDSVCRITTTTDSNNDKRCFIATAAYGSPLHPYVNILREFRDRYLLTNYPGRYFVSFYYYYSPNLAKTIEKNTILKSVVKISLIPAIMFSSFMVKTTLAGKIVVGILFSILFFIFIKQFLKADGRFSATTNKTWHVRY